MAFSTVSPNNVAMQFRGKAEREADKQAVAAAAKRNRVKHLRRRGLISGKAMKNIKGRY
jgi:hypothetical protein